MRLPEKIKARLAAPPIGVLCTVILGLSAALAVFIAVQSQNGSH